MALTWGCSAVKRWRSSSRFLLEDDDVVVDLDDGAEDRLRLEGEVDRAAVLAVFVVGGFGVVELALELGELGFEEAEGGFGFGRAVFDVLADVGVEDFVEDGFDLGAVGAAVGGFDHVGLAGALAHFEVVAQGGDGLGVADAGEVEAGAGAGDELGDEERGLAVGAGGGLADAAFEQAHVLVVVEGEGVVVAGDEGEGQALEVAGDFEALHVDALAAPGVAAEPEEGRGGFVAVVAAREGATEDGEVVGVGADGEVEPIDDAAEDHARAQDLELGGDRGGVAEHGFDVTQRARPPLALFLSSTCTSASAR